MLFWIWLCGVVVNICVQTVDMKSLTGVAFLTTHYKDTMDNLILLTDFNARKKIQQICYERVNLMALRSMVNKFRTFRELNPDVVKIIWQLKRAAPGFRYVNFSNLRQITLMKGQFSDDTIKFWTKFGFGNIQSLKKRRIC